MGVQSDQEIVQLIGSEPHFIEELSLSFKECIQAEVLTQTQALAYLVERNKSLKAR